MGQISIDFLVKMYPEIDFHFRTWISNGLNFSILELASLTTHVSEFDIHDAEKSDQKSL